ncbi:2Fe-2S iron-sulfur cluster binding domain-containing protein [Spongiibacter nanhainus]|uniref:2Fe-2S iron-sulfur cluster binding domain-containing protein n=1 Tax=Spongiibacter nanhainus TaxID=2794344 RepID=A0A7T4QYS8_9GAMM|nr:2Fe-2S iron-sulfur cluster-binding protein [Spongiibacter nanhainus]QQD17304.1 2Fe-2S iron-sulfur cluster binding domain-containing protein [Spongiibacter nanhainus]
MPKLIFEKPDGHEVQVVADVGVSVMQVAVDNGIDEILAECGGACSCATCHCYISESCLDSIEPPAEIESEMLDCVLEKKVNSRLSCQVIVNENMEGLRVILPDSQF